MKIKLIAPARKPEWGESFWDLKTLCKLTGRKSGGAPLALPTLAALTPSDIEVVLTDENVEPINFEEKVDLVGITGMTCVIPRSYEIADEFRRKGIPVVMGGIHVSMLPEEAIQHCDSVVIGEAEEIWEQVMRDAQKKSLQKFYRAPRFPDLTNVSIPRWNLLKNNKYFYFTIQSGRGCPYDCEFCSVKVFNGREYRYKRNEQVVKEVEALQKIDSKKVIFFTDDNILAIPKYAAELMEKLIPLKIKAWWAQASMNRLKDDRILDLMYKAGCRVIFIGFESVSQNSLETINKGQVNRVEEYLEIVNRLHSHGIAVFGSFVLGSDNDDEVIFEKTTQFIDEANIPFAMVNIITPFPASKLYEKLETENRILHKNWEKYNAESVCFKPNFILIENLVKGHRSVMKEIYSYKKIYKRLTSVWRKGIFVREKKNLFSIGRIIFSLKSLLWLDKKRAFFVLKSLWNHNSTSVSAVSLALDYHDYSEGLRNANL